MKIQNKKTFFSITLVSIALIVSCSGLHSNPEPIVSYTATETPSSISSPTLTSTSTSAPLLFHTFYDLPAWMSDPTTPVLAALVIDQEADWGKVIFLNPANGDKVELPISQDVYGLFWQDSNHFGFLMDDLHTTYLLNTQDGQMTETDSTPDSVRLYNNDALTYDDWWIRALQPVTESDSGNVLFRSADTIRDDFMYPFSNKGTYRARLDATQRESIAVVMSSTSGETVWQADPTDGLYDSEFAWSPINDSILAIISGKPEPINGLIINDTMLTIVDVATNNIISSYSGDFSLIEWSPDGKQILSQDAFARVSNSSFFNGSPCITTLETGEIRCLTEIPAYYPDYISLISTKEYNWSQDARSIYYITALKSENGEEVSGDFCIYDLADGAIICPTRNLSMLQGRSIFGYAVSPDQRYIHFCFSVSSTDDFLNPNGMDGIIDMSGEGLISWVGLIQIDGPQTCSLQTLWRPLP
jgi:hypothetical protein